MEHKQRWTPRRGCYTKYPGTLSSCSRPMTKRRSVSAHCALLPVIVSVAHCTCPRAMVKAAPRNQGGMYKLVKRRQSGRPVYRKLKHSQYARKTFNLIRDMESSSNSKAAVLRATVEQFLFFSPRKRGWCIGLDPALDFDRVRLRRRGARAEKALNVVVESLGVIHARRRGVVCRGSLFVWSS